MDEPESKTVLIVDDDEGQRDLLAHIVSKEGFRTVLAQNGPEAMKRMEELMPDAVLLDLMLPAMGGYEILREFQARGAGDVPVIIVTARELDRKSIDALRFEPNVKDVVSKPPNPVSLSGKLHGLLGTRPKAS